MKMKTTENNNGWIRIIYPEITPPSLKDNTADTDRLLKALKKELRVEEVTMGLHLVRKISSLLRKSGYKVRAGVFKRGNSWHLIEIFPHHMDNSIYGLAIDLGSSTVVVRLVDLVSREIMDETSFLNPQNKIGPDILTRIHFASQGEGLVKLQAILIDRLNKEIALLNKKHGVNSNSIVGMSVAGNTTMSHLFLRLDPFWICREPYIPVINQPGLITAADLGLSINPEAPVLVFPNIGSYLGGDIIAGILASGMNHQEDVSILVDVGTNAEVVLGNYEWLIGCAGAAGPALEGGVANMGMMAGPGVIDKVIINPHTKKIEIRTIENKPPVGICGSGLIDLAAQLFVNGMIDLRGKFVAGRCQEQLNEIDGIGHLIVVSAENSATGKILTLSQPDIDSLLRSKAAMYTILTTITNMVNVSIQDFRNFYIAGTFGTYIDPRSAITIGMIPDLSIETFKGLGNSSLAGATMALLSEAVKKEIYQIRDRVTYVELNVNQEFMNLFSAAKFIPHTNKSLFPSVMNDV